MPRRDSLPDQSMRVRWCGICFAWRDQGQDGRCKSCGNAHMTGDATPITSAADQKQNPEEDR